MHLADANNRGWYGGLPFRRHYRDFRKAFVLTVMVCTLAALTYNAQAADRQESISGRSFRAIQAAVPHLERYKLNVTDYQITVWEHTRRVKTIQHDRAIITTESILYVLFRDPDDPPGEKRWRPEMKQAFSVELVKDDFRVIGAAFDK